MRRLLPLVFLPLLAAGCGKLPSWGGPPASNPGPAPAAANWEWTTDAAGGFKVEMPGQPKRTVNAGANHFPECGSVNCIIFSVQNPDANFLLNYWELDTPQASRVPIDGLITSLRNTMNTPECVAGPERMVKLKSGQSAR